MESNETKRPGLPLELPPEPAELSEREREILILVANGASNKEVAQQLFISPNTVKVHLRNIFGKIGVSSRTEAALYAVRAGFVQLAADIPPSVEAASANGNVPSAAAPAIVVPVAPAAPPLPLAAHPRARRWPRWLAAAVLVVVAAITAVVVVPRMGLVPTPVSPTSVPTAITLVTPPRWQARAAMLTARTHLATVAHAGLMYAIGGEAAGAITGTTERYDPASDAWTTLAPKPQPSSDIGAAVIGGLIYVPGGRLASGAVTDVVEVYDTLSNAWDTRAPLPVAMSGYAVASFEGRLYVFGGWNGASYVASVYAYDPAADAWSERTRMPTARGFGAAVVSGGKIFVVGGADAQGLTRAIEAYVPARDSESANPWETLPDGPDDLSIMAATSIADNLYVAGRHAETRNFAAWEYRPEADTWQPLDLTSAPGDEPNWLSVVAVNTHLYVLSSSPSNTTALQFSAYQALYTNLIPVITSGD